MARRCDRCGHTILAGDSECWHCGARLTGNKAAPAVQPITQSQTEPEGESVSLTAVGFYLLTTAVTLFLLFWLVRSLNQRPLYLANPDIYRPPGWTAVTDPLYQYTFNMPARWETIPTEQNRFQLPEQPSVLAALSQSIGQIEPQVWAVAPSDRQLFLLVAKGESSTPAAMMSALQAESAVQNPTQQPHFLGHEQIIFQQTMELNSLGWECRVHIHAIQPQPFWIAVCGDATDMNQTANQNSFILDSFQPLSP